MFTVSKYPAGVYNFPRATESARLPSFPRSLFFLFNFVRELSGADMRQPQHRGEIPTLRCVMSGGCAEEFRRKKTEGI